MRAKRRILPDGRIRRGRCRGWATGMGSEATRIHGWIGRLRAGDDSAVGELLAHFEGRLTCLTRKMLGDFPGVRRWEQTGDVLQEATLRLQQALTSVKPGTSREFLGLAALQIRRE